MRKHYQTCSTFVFPSILLSVLLLSSGCGENESAEKVVQPPTAAASVAAPKTAKVKKAVELVEVDMGPVLPRMKVPIDNPMTPEKISLGEKLFFDTALSADNSMSCATCHDPELGWSNGEKFADGASGIRGKRNTLSILNVGFYDRYLFWDGRVNSLEEQALVPVFEPTEMGMTSEEELLERIGENAQYKNLFAEAFEDGITVSNIAKALASFQRTIYVKEIPYDRYLAGDKNAMSASAIRGEKVFFNKRRANCGSCHPAPMFTDHEPYNIGIGMDQEDKDWGFHDTKGWGFWGKFRSPSLRSIDQTAPYMHDGSLATLEEVVDYYDKGGIHHKYTDVAVQNLRLTDQQKKDLVAFMREGMKEIKEGE
jgi:cytochrome c peroxidase